MAPGSPLPALKKKTLPILAAEQYAKIPASELVVCAIYYLQEREKDFGTEDIVSACFLLFPQVFALKKYQKWPDSALVSRRLSDCREKGLVVGYLPVGFKLTARGAQIARRVAGTLGLSKPKPKVKEPAKRVTKKHKAVETTQPKSPAKPVVKTVKKKGEDSKPEPVKVTKPVEQQKPKSEKTVQVVATAPVIKKQARAESRSVNVKEKAKPTAEKKPIKAAPAPVVEVKPAQTPKVKKVVEKEPVAEVQLSLPIKVEEKPAPPKKKKAAPAPMQQTQPVQPKPKPKPASPARPIWTEPVTPPAPAVKPIEVKKEKPAPTASKEEKARAGKFVSAMERSDAYRLYKKEGRKAKISEFDFRSMLLGTMESSAQTLSRNVETFKGYALIHNRQDLVAFLEFCEEHFVSVLKPQGKQHTLKIGKLRK